MKFSQSIKKATLATVLGASMMMPFSDYIYAQNSSFPETGIVESVTRGETKNEAQKVTNYLEKTNEEIGLLEGKIIEQKGSSVYIDLGPCGTGIIYGREFISAREPLRQLKPNDLVVAKVIDANNEAGYIELSLKDAGQEIIWREVKELERKKETLTLPVSDANKGGLILEWKGIQGFLPTSQLRLKHYPRVEGGDKEKILDELKKLVGENIIVTIIDSDSQEKKLIFSEKGTEAEEIKEIISKYKVGDIIECDITGIVDFGIIAG